MRYIAVDDVGKKINPLIVDGQLHGGIAQGVGQALWEGAVYGEDGQLLTGSMMDYALPRASWLPSFELDETVTPSPVNPLGVKGVGEAGAIASTPAVANAVIDALARWASAISTCRYTAQNGVARHPGARREARHDPRARSTTSGRPALDEALGRDPATAGRKVIAGGQSLLPLLKLRLARPEKLVDIGRLGELRGVAAARRRRAVDRGADDLPRDARLAGRQLRAAARRPADDRRRPGAQPGHDRRRDRPCRPGVRHPGIASSRSTRRSCCGRRAASGPVRLDGFFQGAFTTAMQADELLVDLDASRCQRRRGPAAYASSCSPPRATRWSAWPRSCASGGGIDLAHPGRHHRASASRLPRRGGGGGAAGLGRLRQRRSRRRPPTHDDGQKVNGDIHADAEYRAAMAVVYTRRAIEAGARAPA